MMTDWVPPKNLETFFEVQSEGETTVNSSVACYCNCCAGICVAGAAVWKGFSRSLAQKGGECGELLDHVDWSVPFPKHPADILRLYHMF